MGKTRAAERITCANHENGPVGRLTSIYIDGNSISVVAGERVGGRLRVLAVEHIETGKLLEYSRRLHHQIFMDVDICFFPDKPRVVEELKRVLKRPEFANPCLGVLSPDRVELFREEGRSEKRAMNDRRRALLKDQLPNNPHKYPVLFVFQEMTLPDGQSRTRFARCRLSDYLQLFDILGGVGLPLVGMIPAVSGTSSIARHFFPKNSGQPMTLCHTGKLRTLYSTLTPDGEVQHNMIPVGLARDDVYYFKSFHPSASELERLRQRKGALLLPVADTPSPLTKGEHSEPEVDLTRFAIQVARFCARVETIQHGDVEPRGNGGCYYLSGSAQHVPGLGDFVHDRVRSSVKSFDELDFSSIELAAGINAQHVTENLVSVGALLDYFHPSAVSTLPLSGELLHPPMRGATCSVTKMRDAQLYILEHKPE